MQHTQGIYVVMNICSHIIIVFRAIVTAVSNIVEEGNGVWARARDKCHLREEGWNREHRGGCGPKNADEFIEALRLRVDIPVIL